MAELVDSILVMGKTLNSMNIRLSNIHPLSEDYQKLEVMRDAFRQRYDMLVKYFFEHSAKRFIAVDGELAKVNEEAQAALNKLEKMQKTLDTITKLIGLVDSFITAIITAVV